MAATVSATESIRRPSVVRKFSVDWMAENTATEESRASTMTTCQPSSWRANDALRVTGTSVHRPARLGA